MQQLDDEGNHSGNFDRREDDEKVIYVVETAWQQCAVQRSGVCLEPFGCGRHGRRALIQRLHRETESDTRIKIGVDLSDR